MRGMPYKGVDCILSPWDNLMRHMITESYVSNPQCPLKEADPSEKQASSAFSSLHRVLDNALLLIGVPKGGVEI